MIVNMESIYTPNHWFLSIKMLNRYTTSRTSTKDCEIQLRLPKSKFIMIPIFEPSILNSHCIKRIVCKNVWEFKLKKMFSFKINKLSTTDTILNGKPCNVLYTGYLNKDISFSFTHMRTNF